MPLVESQIDSRVLGNSRKLWYQPHDSESEPAALCLFLDGEFYIDVERVDAPRIVSAMQSERRIPPVAAAYISHIEQPIRWRESFCNDEFVRFLTFEVLPQVRRELAVRPATPVCLIGLSLTGLAAAHAAFSRPDCFPRVVCQSASFWWADEALTNRIPEFAALPELIRITCGSRETIDVTDHGEGLIQTIAQLTACRRMRNAIAAAGGRVSYTEFEGGHEMKCWADDLPDSLAAVLPVGRDAFA